MESRRKREYVRTEDVSAREKHKEKERIGILLERDRIDFEGDIRIRAKR